MLIIVNEANAMVLYALLTSATVVLGLLLLRVTLGSNAIAVVDVLRYRLTSLPVFGARATAKSTARCARSTLTLDRLDEACLFAQTIDLKSYERQRDKLREELTLAQIDHHAESIEELDLQGILAFVERVLRQRHHFSSTWRRPRVELPAARP